MQKRIVPIVCICLLVICVCGYIYSIQYNSHGMGRYLCFEIDESGWKSLGKNKGKEVCTYNLDDLYIVSIMANEVSLQEAFKSEKLTYLDLCKNSLEKEEIQIKKEQGTAYLFENYQIAVFDEYCIIAPLNITIQEMPDNI